MVLGRPVSRRRAIHSPCDSKPVGQVTEWVRRLLHAAFELRLQAPVRWADLPGWFYQGKITVSLSVSRPQLSARVEQPARFSFPVLQLATSVTKVGV